MATKKSNAKAAPQEQTTIPNTGRIDAIPEVETAAKKLQDKEGKLAKAEVERDEANDELTQALIDHNGGKDYQYEGKDGQPYIAYVPKARKPKARIRKVKRAKPNKGE